MRVDDLETLLNRLCASTVETSGVTGSAITLMVVGGLRSLAASTGPVCGQLDQVQFTVGEGPGVDAFAGGAPVLEPDMMDGARARWPVYAPAAHDLGARAVFALPLQVGAINLGVLELYRDRPGSLSAQQFASATAFAQAAVTIVLDDLADTRSGTLDRRLDEILHFPSEVYQATGMLMVALGVDPTEAFVRLRARAYAEGRSLTDEAEDVVAGRLRLTRDPAPEENL